MKIILVFLIMSCMVHGQKKKYIFDHVIEYTVKRSPDAPSNTVLLMTNSADNSYSVYIFPKDSLYFYFNFTDERGYDSRTVIRKSDFYKAEKITIPCEMVKLFTPFKDNPKSPRFILYTKSDTVIAGQSYQQYGMKYAKKRDIRTYKKGPATYIIEPNTEFHKPLMFFSGYYDLRFTDPSFPNGIAREIFAFNALTGEKERIYGLTDFVKINKFVEIPDCNNKQ